MNLKFPLVNISLFEFTRRVLQGGGLSLKGMFMLPLYYIQIIPSLPFEFLQYLFYGQRIKKTIISKDPVFILGHYRTGTTYLQKLIVSDKQFGSLTNYDALFPNANLLLGNRMRPVFQWLINIFKIKNPFFHNSIVQLSDPAEEDDYLMNKASAYSAYWGLVFPKRWREWLNCSPQYLNLKYDNAWRREYLKAIKYATFRNIGKQLILKSPPNTERIGTLLQLFPQAKFIYIHRNPYQLYYSIRNMWKSAILKYYSVQEITNADLDEIVFGHFEYLTEQYEKQKDLIPGGNLVEISYEGLKADSFDVIQKIYTQLNLPGFESAADHLLSKMEIEREYQSFQYQYSDLTFKRIEERWGKYIRQWNYNIIQGKDAASGQSQ